MAVRMDFESTDEAISRIKEEVERVRVQTAKLRATYEEFANLSNPAVPFAKKLVAFTDDLDREFKYVQEANEELMGEIRRYKAETEEIGEGFSI